MKLKPPDSSLLDYIERRSAFMAGLSDPELTTRERLFRLKRWIDMNSPYDAGEKLANIRRALSEDDE